MFKEFRSQVSTLLKDTLQEYDAAIEPVFTMPLVGEFGELSTNICFQLAKTLKKSPSNVADELVGKLKPAGFIKEVKAEKGYLNFYIEYGGFTKTLFKQMSQDYGRGADRKEKIIVEHTSANPDGPLHIGHLRNAVIGDTLARILRFAGYRVAVHYYLNDMGKQTAKVVWGLSRYGLDTGKSDHTIAKVYIRASADIDKNELDGEISDLLQSYEKGDGETVDRFKTAVETCLEGIKETLQRLGIVHDSFVWESRFVRDGSVKDIVKKLEKNSRAKRENGALLLELSDFGISKDMVLTRADGTSLYIARDLAHHVWKLREGGCVNVWGADHKLVADHLKAGLKMLSSEAPEFIIHEFISLPEGSMSTRKGVFISADQLTGETVNKSLEEVKKRRPDLPLERMQRISEDVGTSAVRFNIARIAPEKSMVFKWEEALDFERQGAPFIQYAYARGLKILQKAGPYIVPDEIELDESEIQLVKTISRFPEVVEEAGLSRKVSLIATYASELANTFNGFYMSSKVIGSEKQNLRLSIVNSVVIALGNSMDLLGIKRLDEM